MSVGVCIGCGETLFPETVAVEGFDVCRICLAPRVAPRKLWEIIIPPFWWLAAAVGALLGAVLMGTTLGYTVEVGLRAIGLGISRWPTAFGALFGVLVFAVRLRWITELLDRRWKRKTARQLGLGHLPLDRFAFAVFLLSRQCPSPEDMGLLTETDDALVFLGRREGITVVPLSTVTENIFRDVVCGWAWAHLELSDGSYRWILIREGGETAWGREAATEGFAKRLHAKLMYPKFRIARWENIVGAYAEALAGLTAANLPERIDELWKVAKIIPPPNVNPPRDELDEAARTLVAMALALLLVDRGWAFAFERGEPDILTSDGIDLDPIDLLEKLAKKELIAEEWRLAWTKAGVGDVDLGEFAASKRKGRKGKAI